MKRIQGVLLVLSLICLPLAGRADSTVLEVIPLKHRTLDQVLPVIRPLAGPDGAVTGLNNQLIVRATPADMARIKSILDQIDTAPRRLLITVRQGAAGTSERGGAVLSGKTELGSGAAVALPPDRGREGAEVRTGAGLQARIYDSRSSREEGVVQQLQTLEGSPALIQVGQSLPVPERTVMVGGQGATVVEGTRYQDVTRGFYVLPRVNGNMVTLDLMPQNNRPGPGGSIELQQVSTSVSGRLGEWIPVGGISDQGSSTTSGVGRYASRGTANASTIWVRVEELP